MYPGESGTSQSSHPGHHPHRQSWDPNYPAPPPPPPNGTYPPPPHAPSGRPDRPEMATIHPQHPYAAYPPPGPYSLPAPQGMYAQPPPPQDYRPPPQGQQQAGQSAPRQRTAIACKYCRRRKIRCSGFENSEDGRCSNCVRFSQECVFTPVSAQTQAFVPAQALYGRGRGGPPPGQPQQLYGPYGNRLPPSHHDPYAQQMPPGHAPHPAYTLPSPTAAYPPPHHYGYPPPPAGYEHQPPRHRDDERRDPHAPPPGYAYPDPQHGHAYPPPASGYPAQPQPYYNSEPPRRHSPNSAYSYDPSRHSQSPHGPPYSYPPTSGAQPGYAPAPATQHPTRTPPPNDRARGGMSIHDMVGNSEGAPNGGGERPSTDSDMVSKLNRPAQR